MADSHPVCSILVQASLGLHHIDDVVAQFLAFGDVIDIEGSQTIVVFVLLHTLEVVVAQIVTELVNLVFYLIALADVVSVALGLFEHSIHLLERHHHKVFHMADLEQLFVGEMLSPMLSRSSTSRSIRFTWRLASSESLPSETCWR